MAILEAVDVCKNFGGLKVTDHVSFQLGNSKISGFIGPNGAGKTTLYNLITGFLKVDSGKILLDSKDITNLPPHIVLKNGIARSWQQVRLFEELTVLENILVAIPKAAGDNPAQALFPFGIIRQRSKKDMEKAMSYLEFIGLADIAKKDTGDLSYPEQKLVSMARLLAT
jgi:ABC-type branched-subunit amino acid transport system ATPase component